jgi:hypothetical protein
MEKTEGKKKLDKYRLIRWLVVVCLAMVFVLPTVTQPPISRAGQIQRLLHPLSPRVDITSALDDVLKIGTDQSTVIDALNLEGFRVTALSPRESTTKRGTPFYATKVLPRLVPLISREMRVVVAFEEGKLVELQGYLFLQTL